LNIAYNWARLLSRHRYWCGAIPAAYVKRFWMRLAIFARRVSE
jgi:hypothetical protein